MSNSKQHSTAGSYICNCFNDPYDSGRNSKDGSVFTSADFRYWIPSGIRDCQISCIIICVRPRRCFCTISTREQGAAEVHPIRMKCPYIISFTVWSSLNTQKNEVVRHYETSFPLAVYGKRRTFNCEILLLIGPGWISKWSMNKVSTINSGWTTWACGHRYTRTITENTIE